MKSLSMRALPSLLCVLVVLSSVGGVAAVPAPFTADGPAATPADVSSSSPSPSQSPPPSQSPLQASSNADSFRAVNATPDDVNVISIPAPQAARSGIERSVIDVTRSVAIGTNASGVRISTAALRGRIVSSRNETIRQRRLVSAMNTFASDVETLRGRQHRAIDAYSAETLTEREFLFRLARINAEAGALEDRLTVIQNLAEETEEFSLNGTRRATLRFELRSLGGPVVERVAAVMRGESPSTRVFVETAPESIVLSTIVDETYVRESYRGPLRRGNGTVTPVQAEEIASEAYPTVWGNRTVNRTSITGSGSIYIARVPHAFGHLTAFVDGGSESVFQEYQRRPLDSFDRPNTSSATRDGLRLVVNRTYAGGALRVELVDAESGEPVDATVTIGTGGQTSDAVGRTGADGVLWTLAHRTEFTVTAIKDTRVVLLTVSPEPPDDANGGGNATSGG